MIFQHVSEVAFARFRNRVGVRSRASSMPFAMVSEPRICIPVAAFAASNAITLNAALVFGCGLLFAREGVFCISSLQVITTKSSASSNRFDRQVASLQQFWLRGRGNHIAEFLNEVVELRDVVIDVFVSVFGIVDSNDDGVLDSRQPIASMVTAGIFLLGCEQVDPPLHLRRKPSGSRSRNTLC